MTELILTVTLVDGTPRVLSTDITERFGKRHCDVLRTIQRITEELPVNFNERNFTLVSYTDEKGEKRPAYSLTRDAFSLVVMGFTGKEALVWKVRYIEAFNTMEKALLAAAQKVIRETAPKRERKPKALPPAQPFIPEKGREVMERMLALRGTLYRVSTEMQEVMSAPFWDTSTRPCPEHFKPFAKAMNAATWAFQMSLNKELETATLLFEAFVEAEKVLRSSPTFVHVGGCHA